MIPLHRRLCAPGWSENPTGCKHFGVDPDGAYCGHPRSLAISAGYGADTNRMSREGLCTHGSTGNYELWEAGDGK